MTHATPPFFSNFDGSHCVQCCLRGALEYFSPSKSWSWDELDELTGKNPDGGTWPMTMLLNLVIQGYDVVYIEPFDFEGFAVDPAGYLRKTYSAEASEFAISTSDLSFEAQAARNVVQLSQEGRLDLKTRNVTNQDVAELLAAGYLLILQVNGFALHHMQGYEGHALLIYTLVDDGTVRLHDCGWLHQNELVGRAEEKTTIDHLVTSSMDNGLTGGLTAIRPRRTA